MPVRDRRELVALDDYAERYQRHRPTEEVENECYAIELLRKQ